nr:hypothetical protein [Tanacetum cinerariifolium]
LDTMSIDDLYNNFKIIEQEVKRTVVSSSSSGSPNMAFLSSPRSTNEVDTASIQVSAASTPVSTRTCKKITINGSDTAWYDKKKVECFTCYKMGHFARKCKSPRSQESRPRNQDSSRKTVIMKDTSSKAMVAINGVGFDWSYMDDDEVLTNMALMAFSDSEIIGSQITDNRKTGLGFTSYNAIAPPPTCLFAPLTIDLSSSGLEEFKQPEFESYGPKASKSVCVEMSNLIKKAFDALIIKDWVSDCDKNKSEEVVVKSENVQHTPEQFNLPRKMAQKPVLKTVKNGTGQRKVRPVWNNAMRVNHQNFFNSRRNFDPTAVLTKSGIVPISTVRQISSRAAEQVSTARPINIVVPKPIVNVLLGNNRPMLLIPQHAGFGDRKLRFKIMSPKTVDHTFETSPFSQTIKNMMEDLLLL